jgi:hypothetical protein
MPSCHPAQSAYNGKRFDLALLNDSLYAQGVLTPSVRIDLPQGTLDLLTWHRLTVAVAQILQTI